MERPLVVVADDEPRLAQATARCLQLAFDVEVVQAADGEEALRLVYARQPDLLLLDMRMPRLDGFTVARRLKADPETQPIPIIAVTGHPSPEETLAAGCDDYLPKPFDVDAFLAKVSACLTRAAPPDLALSARA